MADSASAWWADGRTATRERRDDVIAAALVAALDNADVALGSRFLGKEEGATARPMALLKDAGFADAKLHPTLVRRPPGHVSEIMHNEGEDFVYILEGCILLEVGGERHTLNKGDSMHFRSHLPHRSATLGNETTLELWVRTQPLFS